MASLTPGFAPAHPATSSQSGGGSGSGPELLFFRHQCFICLQTDLETPDDPFVNPCPCTLEAHESCLLRWVAESEANRNQTTSKPPRCPACNARIRVDEPHDAVVALRNGIYRSFARASPYVLLTLVFGGGAVGSAWYGLMSAHLFAGPVATARWLGLHTLANRRPSVAVWRWAPMWTFTAKMWALSLVGPGLVIGRAIPAVGNILLVPTSLMSAALLVAWDDMPTWPPSPAWAVTMFPFVSLTYNNIYYEFFGAFERRLDMALRARPAEEDALAGPRPEGQAAGQQGQGEGQQGDNEERQQSIWAAMWGLGQAVVGLFRDQEIVLEAEVIPHRQGQGDIELQIEVGEEQFDEDDARAMAQEVDDILVVNGVQHRQQVPAAEQQNPAQAAQMQGPQLAPAAPQQQGAAQVQQGEAQVQQAQNNDDNDDAAAAGDNNRVAGGTLTDIMSSIALSLLYPGICFGMGELLRVSLPRSWVTRSTSTWGSRPQATGLLQRRWGRSLVGGCLYVVMKDAFKLYAKYRQVQQKSKRRVRNVERRAPT